MEKRGQLTIFIIIAIVVVAGAIILFSFYNPLKSQNPEVDAVYSFVENCIKTSGGEVILKIGEGGGYFFPPELSTDEGITYYYSDGKTNFPLKENIENEIAYYVNKKLSFCVGEFENFPELNISQGQIESSAKILDDKVVLEVKYPLSVQAEEGVVIPEDFEVEIPIRFGVVYDSAKSFVEDSKESVCLSCAADLIDANNLKIDMMYDNSSNTIFVFKDEESQVNNETFILVFANKY